MTKEDLVSSYKEMQNFVPSVPVFCIWLSLILFGVFLVTLRLTREKDTPVVFLATVDAPSETDMTVHWRVHKTVGVSALVGMFCVYAFVGGYWYIQTVKKEEIWKENVLYKEYAETLPSQKFKIDTIYEDAKNPRVKLTNGDVVTLVDMSIDDIDETYIEAKVIPVVEGATSAEEYYGAFLHVSLVDFVSGTIHTVNELLDKEIEKQSKE